MDRTTSTLLLYLKKLVKVIMHIIDTQQFNKLVFLTIVFLTTINMSFSQEVMPIWPEGMKPNDNGIEVKDSITVDRYRQVGVPGIIPFIVDKEDNSGSAVLICPGGAYGWLSHKYSGVNLAHWYNTIGVNAFVLIYRLPHQRDIIDSHLAPIQDAQRAMKLIRENAEEWGIDVNKIGVMGVSAGGHLASTLSTIKNDESKIGDALDNMDWAANFSILQSAVISMEKLVHGLSKENLLGANPSDELLRRYSSEQQVGPHTPPTFVFQAQDDKSVQVENSLFYYNALIENKVNASIHIFPHGGHNIKPDHNPGSTDLWTNLLELWLKEMNLVVPVERTY